MFVSGVVGGFIVLTGGGVRVRGALMRDVGAYLVATVCVAIVMASGQVEPLPLTATPSSQTCMPDGAWQASCRTKIQAARLLSTSTSSMLAAVCLLCCRPAPLASNAALLLAAPVDLTGSSAAADDSLEGSPPAGPLYCLRDCGAGS